MDGSSTSVPVSERVAWALARLRALWFPRRSALRRGSDRVELLARWTALPLVLLAVPVVLAAGTAYGDAAESRNAVARATRHVTTGVVLAEPTRHRRGDAEAAGVEVDRAAPVRWIAPSGAERVAVLDVPVDAPPGETVPVWTDRDGVLVSPPLDEGVGREEGVAVTVLLLLTVAGAAASAVWTVRALLDAARLRAWDREWAVVGRVDGGRTP